VKGWKLDAFNANPVILLNHDDGSGGFLGMGRKDVLPIGKGRAYVEGEALMVDIEFDQKDDLAKRVEQKVADGFLNAVSVRYLLQEGKFKSNDLGGIDSDEQELLEISLVNIPGNQRAVRVKELADAEAAVRRPHRRRGREEARAGPRAGPGSSDHRGRRREVSEVPPRIPRQQHR
jgi:phage head maturation protease